MKVDWIACVLAAIAILILPLNWILAGMLASAFHELCHYLAVKAMGGSVLGVRIIAWGAVIETSSMSPGRELFCVLAGPVGGLLLLLVSRWAPRVAICGVLQSAYNILPVYPLDGGRAVGCVVELLPERYRKYGREFQYGISVAISSAAVLAALVLRLPALVFPFLPIMRENFLAKKGKKGYNIVTLK